MTAGEVRLDAHTTKNGDGRVFPLTADLRALLKAREAERDRLKKAGHPCPFVFFREIADHKNDHTLASKTPPASLTLQVS